MGLELVQYLPSRMASIDFNWNVFPSTKLEERHMVTPLGCMITPFANPAASLLDSEPLPCSLCGAYLNACAQIDYVHRTWRCPMCSKATSLPTNFKGQDCEGGTSHYTSDFLLPSDISLHSRSHDGNLVFALVIDLYQHTDSLQLHEFNHLKQVIAENLMRLPLNSRVLLVTLSDSVKVHKPRYESIVEIFPDALHRKGEDWSNLFTNDSLLVDLKARLFPGADVPSQNRDDLATLLLFWDSHEKLIAYIESLKPKLTNSYKPDRATGLAMFITILICSSFTAKNSYGKIMAFFSGPASSGPGAIVYPNETIRLHKDISNLRAPHFASASKFYKALGHCSVGISLHNSFVSAYSTAGKLVDFVVPENASGFSIDIYTGSLDQVGIYEMRAMVSSSGGVLVITDSFMSAYFRSSLEHNLQQFFKQKQNCKLKVLTSPGIKIMRLVGNCTELQSSYQTTKHRVLHCEKISDTVTKFDSSLRKRNDTNQWHLGSVSPSGTFAIFFEMQTAHSSRSTALAALPAEIFIQFQFRYWDSDLKAPKLRVVTIRRPTMRGVGITLSKQAPISLTGSEFPENDTLKQVKFYEGFDAKAWVILLARLVISKLDTSLGFDLFDDVVTEVDNCIVKILKYFGGVEASHTSYDNPLAKMSQGYIISDRCASLPTLAYNLRRNSQLLNIFNSSPDETALNHHTFMTLDLSDSCRFLSPALYRVKDGRLISLPVERVSLESETEQTYFVLDCVSQVIVFNQFILPSEKLPLHHSENDPGILAHTSAELKTVLLLLDSNLLHNRDLPAKLIVTQRNHSQARYLMAWLCNSLEETREPRAIVSWWGAFKRLGLANKPPSLDVDFDHYYNHILSRVRATSADADF